MYLGGPWPSHRWVIAGLGSFGLCELATTSLRVRWPWRLGHSLGMFWDSGFCGFVDALKGFIRKADVVEVLWAATFWSLMQWKMKDDILLIAHLWFFDVVFWGGRLFAEFTSWEITFLLRESGWHPVFRPNSSWLVLHVLTHVRVLSRTFASSSWVVLSPGLVFYTLLIFTTWMFPQIMVPPNHPF